MPIEYLHMITIIINRHDLRLFGIWKYLIINLFLEHVA
jgi:hypothetical protein